MNPQISGNDKDGYMVDNFWFVHLRLVKSAGRKDPLIAVPGTKGPPRGLLETKTPGSESLPPGEYFHGSLGQGLIFKKGG